MVETIHFELGTHNVLVNWDTMLSLSVKYIYNFQLYLLRLAFTCNRIVVVVRVINTSDLVKIENRSCKQNQNGSIFL